MNKIVFYPIGNADTYIVQLDNGENLLFDFANMANPDDEQDKRVDVAKKLRQELEDVGRDYFDVVAFTHLDDDHIHGASEFFHLEHAKKYQGQDRIQIKTLYVPAAAIVENGCKGEARIIQAEARHRLLIGDGIRVFSRPGLLKEWLKKNDLRLEDRQHLITDAGQLAPEFSLEEQGVEFFVHSPFASRLEDGGVLDRNSDALAFQATFRVGSTETRFFLGADLINEILRDIVNITKFHGNESRLEWDIFKISHHCSYLSLAPDKGKDKTEPIEEVRWLFEEQGNRGGVIVSTSKPIPSNDNDKQPPHRQAANYYKEVAAALGGQFIVTMEQPTKSAPEPLRIDIDGFGLTIKKVTRSSGIKVTSHQAPRAG